MKQLLMLMVMVVIIASLAACSEEPTTIKLSVGEEVLVPTGYRIIDVAAYGGFQGTFTYYCQQDGTGRIFECGDDIGPEIVIPDGYFFIGAAAHGTATRIVIFYCGKEDSYQVFLCNPPQ